MNVTRVHGIRVALVNALEEKFADYNITCSIGGQVSFGIFPTGWDKAYRLRYTEDECFEKIHCFGDKITIGHSRSCFKAIDL